MYADFRLLVAGMSAAGLCEYPLSESIEVDTFAIANSGRAYLRLQTQAFQLPHRMRQQGDSNSQFFDRGRCFVNLARQAHPVKIQRGRKTGDPATNDCNRHGTTANGSGRNLNSQIGQAGDPAQ